MPQIVRPLFISVSSDGPDISDSQLVRQLLISDSPDLQTPQVVRQVLIPDTSNHQIPQMIQIFQIVR